MTEKIRFGQVLIGQDFCMPGSPVVFRRTQGRFAAPVAHIGGHVNGYGGAGFPYDLNMEVHRVLEDDRIEVGNLTERPQTAERAAMKQNTPYDHAIHGPILKSVAPSFRQVPGNAFGDSGSNQNWFECDVKPEETQALINKLDVLGIYAGEDSAYPGRRCWKLCKYVMDDGDGPAVDRPRPGS